MKTIQAPAQNQSLSLFHAPATERAPSLIALAAIELGLPKADVNAYLAHWLRAR